MASQMGCSVCVKELSLMTEPVTTSCGHTFCWPCIHLWVEARKEAVTEDRETLEMARRCPSCRRAMVSLTPLFGFGVSRVEEDEQEIPRRPTEIVDPFKSVYLPPTTTPPITTPPTTTPPTTTSTSVRRSGRQVVPNPRYNQFGEDELPSPPHVPIFRADQRSMVRGGHHVHQDGGVVLPPRGGVGQGLARNGGLKHGVRGGGVQRGRGLGGKGTQGVRRGARVPGNGRGRSTQVQNLSQEVEFVEEAVEEEEERLEIDAQLPEPAVVASALSSSLVPGSRRSYQETVTEYTRDYLVEKQTNYRDMVASKVVFMIRETFPLAWGAQSPGQAGKCLRKILDKAIRNRKMQKLIVSRSGVSGQKLTRLEELTDEIINFNAEIEGAEYIATKVRSILGLDKAFVVLKSTRMTAEEKKRKGQILRNQALTAAGTSRTREPRLDTIVRDSLSSITNSVGKKLTSDNLARDEFEMRKLEREAVREKKENEERLYRALKDKEEKEEREKKDKEQKEERKREREREDKRDQLNQIFQFKLINSLQRSEDQTASVQLDQDLPNEKLEINLKMKYEEDSESYPAKLFVGSFEELIRAIQDFCSLDHPIQVILFHMNRILDLHLLELGRTYLVEWKKKDGYSKVYLD